MASGKSREEAEADPAFHTITRWLGADSVDHSPEIASQTIEGPGWLLVCSDGLWNYASALTEMRTLLSDLIASTGIRAGSPRRGARRLGQRRRRPRQHHRRPCPL